MGGTLPDMVKRAAPIAGTAKNTMHDFLFTETLVDAIASDPGFNKGFYTSPTEVREDLLRHAKIWAVMGWMFPIVLSLRHSNQICLNEAAAAAERSKPQPVQSVPSPARWSGPRRRRRRAEPWRLPRRDVYA